MKLEIHMPGCQDGNIFNKGDKFLVQLQSELSFNQQNKEMIE